MAQTLTLVPAGLHTDPNPLSLAPDGALTEALNVWIRRPGVLEPRPALQSTTISVTGPNEHIAHLFRYGEALIVVTVDSSDVGRVYIRKSNGTYAQITQAGTYAGDAFWSVTQPTRIRGVTCQGNHYLTVGEGVMRIAGETATTAPRAGMPRPPQGLASSVSSGYLNYPLLAERAVAYRLVYRQRIGEREFRSSPSARILARSYTGSPAAAVSIVMPFAAPYDVEVYRSAFIVGHENEPSDEMTLVGTIAAGGTQFVDDVPAANQRGAALYTNATQQGANLENRITPLCRDLAVYREMLCFAGATRAPVLTFEVLGYGPDWRDGQDYSAQRCGTGGTITATVTMGSNVVTGLAAADIKRVHAGMLVNNPAFDSLDPSAATSDWPANTTVVSVNVAGGSFTTSANALSNGAQVVLLDWIEIEVVDGSGTTTERLYPREAGAAGRLTDSREFINAIGQNVRGIQSLAWDFSDRFETKNVVVSAFGDGVNTPWTVTVESYKYDVTSITIRCNRPDYTADRIGSTTGKTATISGGPSYLEFSKPREPEHVPPPYFLQIGDMDGAIDRIVPTRDSLFVFKTDGIFRVSGYTPDTLQVDEFDRNARLVHPEAACEWEGSAAAWTDRGLFLLGDGGQVDVGAPIANDLRDWASEIMEDLEVAGSGRGVFLAPWRHANCLFLGVTNFATSTGSAQYVYVWSAQTRTWSRWTHAREITSFCAIDEDEYFGLRALMGADAAYLSATGVAYDASYSVSITAAGTAVTIVIANGWSPVVGDAILSGGSTYFVTSVTDPTHVTVHVSGLPTGVVTAVQNAPSTISWVARDAENPGAQKHWRDLTPIFGLAPNAIDLRVDYTTDRSGTTSRVQKAFDGDMSPRTIRTGIPTESRRCARLFPTMQLSTAEERDWELHGVSMVYEPMETRHRDVT